MRFAPAVFGVDDSAKTFVERPSQTCTFVDESFAASSKENP